MKVLDAEFVKGFMRMADDGWQQGWHERNGGNLSYRIKPEEVESVKEELNPGEWKPIGTTVPKLARGVFPRHQLWKVFPQCDNQARGFLLHH